MSALPTQYDINESIQPKRPSYIHNLAPLTQHRGLHDLVARLEKETEKSIWHGMYPIFSKR